MKSCVKCNCILELWIVLEQALIQDCSLYFPSPIMDPIPITFQSSMFSPSPDPSAERSPPLRKMGPATRPQIPELRGKCNDLSILVLSYVQSRQQLEVGEIRSRISLFVNCRSFVARCVLTLLSQWLSGERKAVRYCSEKFSVIFSFLIFSD
jgi:hypothetical protein